MSALTDVLLEAIDPINALMLLVIWWRLERFSGRINRIENEFIDGGLE
jgi:hypothetical protein